MEGFESGESSRRKHTNDDDSGNNRPLKKAKFPWQIKGYKIRDQDESVDDDTEDESCSNENEINDADAEHSQLIGKVENNLEVLGDYLLKHEINCNYLFESEQQNEDWNKNNEESESSGSSESCASEYPVYTPCNNQVPKISDSNNSRSQTSHNYPYSWSSNNARNCTSNNYPLSVYLRKNSAKVEDEIIKRWQARQIAKGYVDNTINRVLDSWFTAPFPPNAQNQAQMLGVTELLDDLTGNNNIENEGILMAISAHGLQNSQNSNEETNGTSLPPTSNTGRANDHTLKNDQDDITQMITDDENISSANTNTSTMDLNDDDYDSDYQEQSLGDIKVSSSPTESCRRVSSLCTCSHPHRTESTTRINIPFHRRNYSNGLISSSDPTDPRNFLNNDMNVSNSLTQGDLNNVRNEKSMNIVLNEKTMSKCDNNPSFPPQVNQNNVNNQFEEHIDFIDAAVSIAIQAKGLIPL